MVSLQTHQPSAQAGGEPGFGESGHLGDALQTVSESAGSAARGKLRLQVKLPQTMSLLVFRNADRGHKGEAVFIKKWPPASFSQLLKDLDVACRTLAGPAEALLTAPDLVPVRSLDEIMPGTYLLKGHEVLDPPLLFFDHPAAASSPSSLRHVSAAREHVATKQDTRQKSMSPVGFHLAQSRSLPNSLNASLQRPGPLRGAPPTVGSPPWSMHSPATSVETPQRGSRWSVDSVGMPSSLHMTLSWGGLSHSHHHHHYETWRKVGSDRKVLGTGVMQSSADSSIDRSFMASTL